MCDLAPPAPVRVQLLTLRFAPALGAFDSTPLERFLSDKELLRLREHFFTVQGVPHLACLVWYRLPQRTKHSPSPSATARSPTPTLSDADRALFETLRTWRAERAKAEGLPPYVIFTNRELAAIAGARPASLNALNHVPGVGSKKVERYGRDVVALTASEPEATNAAEQRP